jgi:hypothetical protein
MKNPVALLNEYRVELLSNRVGFSVLTHILRNLSSTAEELSKGLELSLSEVANSITDLYRAGLVSVSFNGRHFLRPKCHLMLAELDLIGPALKSQAEDLLPTTYEKYLAQVFGTDSLRSDLKSSNLLFCQISRIANEGPLKAPERIWYKTLEMLNECVRKTETFSPEHRAVLGGDFELDKDHFRKYLDQMYADPSYSKVEFGEVWARFIVVLVTYRLAGNLSVRPASCSPVKDMVDVLFADSKVSYVFEAKTVHDLWARCAPEPVMGTDIRSEIENALTESARVAYKENATNPWIRFLLPDNK